MEPSLLGLIIGFKLAIFVTLLVYVCLADISLRTKGVYWINLMAVAFIAVSVWELMYVLSVPIQTYNIEPWLLPGETLNAFAVFLYALAGVGILLFLQHVNSNLNKFR